MRPGVPWSVKGIEPEAREAAKQAARRAGVTLGAWLNQVIMESGTDDINAAIQNYGNLDAASSQPQPPAGTPYMQPNMQPAAFTAAPAQPQVDLSPVTEAVRDLVRRIDSNERLLETSLDSLAGRIESSEQLIASGGVGSGADSGMERKVQQLTDRLEAAEKARLPFAKNTGDRLAFQTLEKTMNAVVDHLETVDSQSEQKFAEMRHLLSELADRVDNSEEAKKLDQERAKTDALGNTLQNLSERMAETEQALHAANASAEQGRRQAVEEAVQIVSNKLDSDNQRAQMAELQSAIEKMNSRIDHSEAQSAHAIKTLEGSLTAFVDRLEQTQVRADDIVPQVMEQLDGRLEQVVSRVTDSETRALETASSVEQALSSLAQTMNATEQRNAATRETVQSMVAQVNERIESIESGAGLPLSPTIAVGAGLAGMPAPPLSSAPMPPPGFAAERAPDHLLKSPVTIPSSGPPLPSMPPVADEPPAPVAPMADAPRPPSPLLDAPAPPLSDVPPPPSIGPAAPGDLPPPPPLEPPIAAPAEPPVMNEKKAARDFIAAARRAAQSAHQTGDTASLGFGEQSDRYAAFEDQEEGRGKRLAIIIGGAVVALIVVLTLVNWLVAPSTPEAPGDDIDVILDEPAPGDSLIDDLAAVPDATVPDTVAPLEDLTVIPEAIPEDAGTADAAAVPASTPSLAVDERPAPEPLPEPRTPASAAPRAIVPNSADMPPVAAAPTTPVTQAPTGTRNALRSAAAAGNPAAQYEVGLRYARGGGVPQDYGQAAYWFELAGKQNLAIAQYRLATLFEKGRGVPQDMEKARSWYESAAQAGNVKAMHNLAVIYAEGKGVPQDFAKAGQWFLAAADHGLADSQYNVAVLFERGLGVSEDLPEAFKWFSVAAANGDEGAAARRDAIAEQMDANTLVDAKLAAQTWTPKRGDPIANGNLTSLGNWSNASLTSTGGASSTPQASAEIAKAQRLLRDLGYQPGPADGLMGPRTRDAISDFQRTAGLEVSGSVDAQLLSTLEAYVR
ncbi:localization factor PodJL [Rhodobiaceae bacterium]|nr:localization factor PodJL [Rhodobiaceae bacterium]